MIRIYRLFLIAFFALTEPAQAREIELFYKNKPAADYDEQIVRIRRGDVLIFGNGKRFQVVGEAGKDLTTVSLNVLELGTKKAGASRLQLNLASGNSTDALEQRTELAESLSKFSPQVFPAVIEKVRGQYLNTQLDEGAISLPDFLARYRQMDRETQRQQEWIFEDFYSLARALAPITARDLKPSDLVWNGSHWQLTSVANIRYFQGDVLSEKFDENPLESIVPQVDVSERSSARILIDEVGKRIKLERRAMTTNGSNPYSKVPLNRVYSGAPSSLGFDFKKFAERCREMAREREKGSRRHPK